LGKLHQLFSRIELKVLLPLALAGVAGVLLYRNLATAGPEQTAINNIRQAIKATFPLAQQTFCPLSHSKLATIRDDALSMQIHYTPQL
jgi:hypothetical protein